MNETDLSPTEMAVLEDLRAREQIGALPALLCIFCGWVYFDEQDRRITLETDPVANMREHSERHHPATLNDPVVREGFGIEPSCRCEVPQLSDRWDRLGTTGPSGDGHGFWIVTCQRCLGVPSVEVADRYLARPVAS